MRVRLARLRGRGLAYRDPPADPGTLPGLRLPADSYARWIAAHDKPTPAECAAIAGKIHRLTHKPVFSIRPVGTSAEDLRASLALQTYPHWTWDGDGDFLVILGQGTRFAPTALFELAAALDEAADCDVLTWDDDVLDAGGQRLDPRFRPPWDPDLVRTHNVAGEAVAYRAGILSSAARDLGSHERLLMASAGLPPNRFRHVAAVLSHRAHNPPQPCRTIAHEMPNPPPLVSIVIPTRDRASLLDRCVDGLLRRTDYGPIEILIVDNDSAEAATRELFARLSADPRVRVVRSPGAFNWSALNNAGVAQARGEIVVLLNNDIDVIAPGWLAAMVALALRPDTGLVGAKLLYPDDTVQHAGMTIGPGAYTGHLMRRALASAQGYQGMLALPRTAAAVTGACMALRRSVYLEAGGCEQDHLRVGHGDVDLCLRVRALGYRVVWTPDALLYHLEAASRGLDVTRERQERLAREREYLIGRWGEMAQCDPTLSPNLSVVDEQVVLANPPRVRRAWRD